VILIGQGQIEQCGVFPAELRHRMYEPGAEAIRVDGYAQACMRRIRHVLGQHRQLAPQLGNQDGNQLCVPADARADLRGGAGLAADDQDRPEALLEKLHTLRYG
jgi:hypothetical protein